MAKVIMVQGTMSGAGKSLIAAGLCRIFHQDGLLAMPFKSQNMALNSFITVDGLEMGRAQVMQAEAAGVEPSVNMNPILLKPTGDMKSQVILNGRVLGSYTAREYFSFRKELIPQIKEAYEKLAQEADVIVIEGAGSPAEINLKQDDIVNMGMAKLANAPVLLVGDIDRGGVFAQLYGTVSLLEEAERRRIRGLIVNKFRGDRSLLTSGEKMLEELTGVPVVGVVPWTPVRLDDEDSLSLTDGMEKASGRGTSGGADVEIAVIRLPRISNFTDFIPLELQEGICLRYVERADQLGRPDLIILPGTKNTMGDLRWLRESGLAAALLRAHQTGSSVLGICGGFQMLGQALTDPDGVEDGGTLEGLGLLPLKTVFTPQKTRTRVEGRFGSLPGVFAPLSDCALEGYEIHMGQTTLLSSEAAPLTRLRLLSEPDREGMAHAIPDAGEAFFSDGAICENVMGTYVHGLFDRGEVVRGLLVSLAKEQTDPAWAPEDYAVFRERQYDLLAKTLRESLDMKQIYHILEEGV